MFRFGYGEIVGGEGNVGGRREMEGGEVEVVKFVLGEKFFEGV